MRLAAPEWLIFVPILVFAGWYWKHLGLWKPLRAVILAAIVLLLTRPEWQAVTKGLDVWVLVDRSASAEDLLQPRFPEWEGILESSRREEDRLFVTDFADTAVVRGMSDRELFNGNVQHTRLSLGIHHVLSQMATDRASRILVLSDGFSTEPLSDLNERLLDQQVPLDFRLVADTEGGDIQVQRIAMPSRVQIAEPFLVEAALRGNLDQDVPYAIIRNGARIGTGTARVETGRGMIRFTDRLSQPGGHHYEVVIQPAPDAHAGNNIAENWIEVMGGPRVLLVSGYRSDPVADVLRAQGFDVVVVEDTARLHTGDLSGARAVLFNNVPAYTVPIPFLEALDFFVRTQGGGFLMAGGRFSFGSGGYFESAVDGLLPVSMDLREDHKKLAVAMAIVMDRSGSMGAGVAGGTPGATKMDLANEGAARAIELLGLRDMIAVFAVDSKAHEVVPLTSIGGVRNELMQTVRRIQSGGGGIYVYNGLEAAWDQLKSRQCHRSGDRYGFGRGTPSRHRRAWQWTDLLQRGSVRSADPVRAGGSHSRPVRVYRGPGFGGRRRRVAGDCRAAHGLARYRGRIQLELPAARSNGRRAVRGRVCRAADRLLAAWNRTGWGRVLSARRRVLIPGSRVGSLWRHDADACSLAHGRRRSARGRTTAPARRHILNPRSAL